MTDEIVAFLPTTHQRLAVTVLALLGVIWIVRQVRYHRIREEHALLWFAGLGSMMVVIWVDPLLVGVTRALGVDVPASALLLLAMFFLFITAVWLTSIVSAQKQQITELFIAVSILRARVADAEASPEPGDAPPPGA